VIDFIQIELNSVGQFQVKFREESFLDASRKEPSSYEKLASISIS